MNAFIDASSIHALQVQNVLRPSFSVRTPRLPALCCACREERDA
jgi:hypothetical protein